MCGLVYPSCGLNRTEKLIVIRELRVVHRENHREIELRSGMAHETIFALKKGGRWCLMERPCEPSELDSVLELDGFAGNDRRIIMHHHVDPAFAGIFSVEYALKAGWHQHWDCADWYPMEEEMPHFPGSPVPDSIQFKLNSIAYGWLAFTVLTHSESIECNLEDIEDSLVQFVRFVQLLEGGKFPHAALQMNPVTSFVTNRVHNSPDKIRLVVNRVVQGTNHTIDILMERSDLVQKFREFLRIISEDDGFGHMYLLFGSLPDEEFDLLSDEAESDWKDAIERGLYPDEQMEREKFISHRLIKGIKLTEPQEDYVSAYREMLRTLDIPNELLVSHYL